MEEQGKICMSEEKRIRRAHLRQQRKLEKEAEEQRLQILQEKKDCKYMKEAIRQAKKAAQIGEVPIGCVIVHEDKIVGRGYNRRNTDKSTLSHAEITAIRKASKVLDDWRLENCTLYVTLEPCQMCAGAIVQARIPRVVMGCMNPKAGCAGSILNILEMKEFNHQVIVKKGILEEECSNLLKDFFQSLRKRLKVNKKQDILKEAMQPGR